MKIKKGDYVQIMTGTDKGKRGKVLRVLPKKNKVIVEGLNYIYKHLKKSQKHPQGGRIQKEAPIDVSNVMLYCVHTEETTRTGYRFEMVEEDTKSKDKKMKKVKVRYSKKSNRAV